MRLAETRVQPVFMRERAYYSRVLQPEHMMTTQVPSRRRSSAYSLDEAARIRRAIGQHSSSVQCPSCGSLLSHTVGTDGPHAVWLVRCDACDRSLVIRDPAEEVAGG